MPDKTINIKHNINNPSGNTTKGGSTASTFDKKITAELQKLPKELSNSIKTGLSSSLDSAVKKIENLDKTISSLKTIRTTGTGASTGGGISLNEIKSFVTAVKDIATLFSGLKNDFNEMRKTAKEISGSNKELYKNLSDLITQAKVSVRGKVSRVTEKVQEDPKQLVMLLAKEISKIPALKETTVGKVSQAVPNVDKLISAFMELSGELKKQVGEKKITIEGVGELTKSIDKLLTNFKGISKIGGVGDSKIDDAISKIDNIISKVGKISTTISKPIQIPIDEVKFQNDIEAILKRINPKINVDATLIKKELDIVKKDFGKITPNTIGERQRVIKESGGSGSGSVLALAAYKQALEKAIRDGFKTNAPDLKEIGKDVFIAYKDAMNKLPTALSAALEKAWKSGDPKELLKVTGNLGTATNDKGIMDLVKGLRDGVVVLRNASQSIAGQGSGADKLFTETIKQFDKFIGAIEKASQKIHTVVDDLNALSGSINNIQSETQKTAHESKKIVSTSNLLSKYTPQISYKEGVIRPSEKGEMKPLSTGFTKVGKSFQESVDKRAQELSKSLYKLQSDVINTLESSFKQTQSGWSIVKDKGKPASFKLAGEGAGGDRQWRLDLANVNALKRELKKSPKSTESPSQLIKEFKESFIEKTTTKAVENKQISTKISEWLKMSSEKAVEDLREQFGDSITDGLKNIKLEYSGSTEVSKKMTDEVVRVLDKAATGQSVFKATYGKMAADRELSQKGLVKSVALPAARVAPEGDMQFQTLHGSKRAIPKFATFKTGFEEIYDTLKNFNKLKPSMDYAGKIKTVGLRPTTVGELDSANKLAERMVKDLGNIPEMKHSVVEQYKVAATSKGFDLQKAGIGKVSDFEKKISKAMEMHADAVSSGKLEKGIDNFIKSMDEAGLSAYDFVKSMDVVKFENIYDIIGKVLSGGKSLTNIAEGGVKQSSIRKYENVISEIEGLMPIIKPGRPRRGLHMENIVNMMSQTSSVFSRSGEMDFEKQKRDIKDLNIRLSELVDEAKELSKIDPAEGRKRSPIVGDDVSTISTLGVPEHQASRYDEFKSIGKALSPLNAVVTKMYTENLTELAPFGAQFGQLGRNISNVTNALSSSKIDMEKLGLEGVTTEFPALRTTKERDIIESGRYGKSGYGFNVMSELRHTAGTFEDQILISGKLAKALTQATSNLVGPSPMGRLSDSKDSEAAIRDVTVSDIKTGLVKDIDSEISKTLSTFQEILGEPQKYKGRADKALIDDVKKTISVVRGSDVEVQTAKLAEVFMNYLGRKIVTRYGSKGVGVTPTGIGPDVDIKEILQKYGGSVKVMSSREEAGLGTALMPKSMGKLASELINNFSDRLKTAGMDKSGIESLKTDLSKSGNKFLIEMFKNTELGVVPKEEASIQTDLFNKYTSAMKSIFGEGIDVKSDSEGIKQLKSIYSETYKSKGIIPKLYEEKPIDVRISAYGAGKRGLQPEVLESVMNNIVGDVETATTLKTKFKQPVYEKLLGKTDKEGKVIEGELSKYSRELGYKTTVPGGVGGTAHTKLIDEIGKKAADLEAISNYYVDVIDEFGKMRKSLVGGKFVQIVEEPGETKEWETQEIERGMKGEKLNIPAFAAYQTVFGETSEFMKELNSTSTLDTGKYFEYIKALQSMNAEMPKLRDAIMDNLPIVDLAELQKFEARTGTKGTFPGSERSLTETVLDVEKFPTAFRTKIPSTINPKEMQDFYVPGALARGTYPEPLIAGEYGMDEISRRLQTVINMAKNLEDALKPVEGAEVADFVKKGVGSLVGESWSIARDKKGKSGGLQRQQEIYDLITNVLSTEVTPDPRLNVGMGGLSERSNVEEFLKRQLKTKKPEEAYATAISRAADIAIGKQPGKATPEQASAVSVLDRAVMQGRGKEFSQALKMEAVDEQKLKKAVSALERAKIDYYNGLAEAVLGKKGGVAEVLFTRKIPAVMSKAVNATVDKTEDLKKFSGTLKSLSSGFDSISGDYGLSEFEDIAQEVDSINKEHSKKISRLKEAGLPVLKQEELGINPSMAKKLSVEFTKRFEIGAKREVKRTKDEKVSGSLYDLIKYTEELKSASKKTDLTSETKDEITNHIENELAPYIESVRFPFTGTSTIQPYKPKLLYPKKDQRDIGKNILTVPGMPEMDIEAFDKIMSKVKTKRVGLEKARTEAFGMGDVEKANELTKIINQLNKAISDVIPKYIAHQQKLDYDGDAIEIHTAVTEKARQEIKKHFDSINKDVDSTASIFRDAFTYGAIQKPTGEYPISDMMQAFEKKFDPEKGFEFLKKPFLTKELEYLSPSEQVDILSKKPGMVSTTPSDIKTTLKNIAQQVLKTNKEYEKVSNVISEVKPDVGETGGSYANKVMSVIDDSSKVNKDAASLIKSGVRTRLFEEKFADTIEAQLYKLHTGAEVESVNRVQRLVESKIGFGAGMIGEGGKLSGDITARYPSDLKAYGGNVAKEIHTQLNEFVRFAQQKGMDVKHAGEKPVAGEMIKAISKGTGGASSLWEKIQEDKTYGELKDFADANEESIRRRLEALPTEEIRKEATQLAQMRGGDVSKVSGYLNREELITGIIEELGFGGFLKELAIQIEESAVAGLSSTLKSMSQKQRTKIMKSFSDMNIDEYAVQAIKDEQKKAGINIKKHITDVKQPMYGLRSFSSSTENIYKKYTRKTGLDIQSPEFSFHGMSEPHKGDYTYRYKKAQAVSMDLYENLRMAGSSKEGSAYSKMILSSIERLYADYEKINSIIGSLGNYDVSIKRDIGSIANRITQDSDISNIAKDVIGKPTDISDDFIDNMNKKVDDLSRLAGLPSLGKEEARRIETGTDALAIFGESAEKFAASTGLKVDSDEYTQKVNEFVEAGIAKAKALLQLDKVLLALKVKSTEYDVVKSILPMGGLPSKKTAVRGRQYEGSFEKFKSTHTDIKSDKGSGWYASSYDDKFSKYDYLEDIVTKATGGLNKLKGTTFKNIYRASGIHGGGRYDIPKSTLEDETARFETQVNSIVKSMQGETFTGKRKHVLKSSSILGTGLHSKIENIQKEKYGDKFQSELLVMFKDEVAGLVTGHIDALLRSAEGVPEKVMDVKTVGKDIISDIGAGKTVPYKGLDVNLKTRQKIEDAMSQVNFYLKALAEQEGYRAEDIKGEIQFYDRLNPESWASVEFDYDPERYARDMKAISEARKRIDAMSTTKGKPKYARTGSKKELIEHYKKQQAGEFKMSNEEIDALIAGSRQYFEEVVDKASASRVPKSEENVQIDDLKKAKSKIRKERGRKTEEVKKSELEQYMVPPPIVEGDELESIFENLKSFHSEAKGFQLQHRGLGFDTTDYKELHEDIKKSISEVYTNGPKGKDFMKTINRLKESGGISDSDVLKSWKYYRMAVGDFFIKQANQAQKTYRELDVAGDVEGARKAYQVFESNVGQMQNTIHRGLGKTTDIYTESRRYIDPQLAKGAGVFLNPRQLLERARGPIGDDVQLREVFQKMIGDTININDKDADEKRKGGMKPPIVKAREAFKTITGYDDDLTDLLTDAEKLKKLGPDIVEAWDLTGMVDKITRLRESMQQFLRFNFQEDFEAPQRKNIQNTIGFLKNIETMYTPFDLEQSTRKGGPGEWGEMGIARVPKWESPKIQQAMHSRNLQRVGEYFGKSEEKGGAKSDERFTYMEKIFDQAGNVVKSVAHDFKKYGEGVDAAGEKVGYFNEKQRDLIAFMQGSGRGFQAAIMRAVKWGAASTIVYGGFGKLKESIGTLAEIETGLASLRMVMSPIETDFEALGQAAIDFGKEYGVAITDVLKSMKIFAQQGLSQSEVIERTRTSTLAANVTTLNAQDATEALTAAMKVFRQEGDSSMRFMDAWSEVEAKHAITAGDLANAIKKVGSAAKNAGIDFDELNGMVTAVGSVTRQTGKEVGTAMRFIVRRLTTEKGPKELAKLGIPVSEGPELRGGFDILSDLSKQWDDLTSAQKMNMAQAIGGTRQYNALLVLMDNWDEALRTIKDSTNSKGSAERRNLELMKTYAKQLEQTKAAATELQVSFGKIVLPAFKGVLKGTRLLLEFFSSIPDSVKMATAAVAGFFGFMAKGGGIVDAIVGNYKSGKSAFGDVFSSLKDEWKATKYEIFGKGFSDVVKTPTGNKDLLKTILPIEGKDQGKTLRDFHTGLGKFTFVAREAGLAYNDFIKNITTGTLKGSEAIGKFTKEKGDKLNKFGNSEIEKAAAKMMASEGALTLPAIVQGALGIGSKAVGKPMEVAGMFTELASEKLGSTFGGFAESWVNENTGLVKSIAPLIGSVYLLYKALNTANGYYNRITLSAAEFEKAIYGVRRANESELVGIRDSAKEYDRLQTSFEKANALKDPEVKKRRQELGTYESPLLGFSKLQKDSIGVANTLAETNINLVSGYDKLGNAVLKATDNFKNFIEIAERTKLKDMAKTELDVAARYVQDLTELGGAEEWKSELKSLLGEFPVVGEMLAKHIKVSPAKALDTVGNKLNDMFELKGKYPLSTAADKDIKELQSKLKKAREGFNSTYDDFRKTLSNISTEGLSIKDISDIFTDERLTEGYKLTIDVEPEFRFAGKGKKGTRFDWATGLEEEWSSAVNWQDVAGSEILKRSNKGLRSLMGATSSITAANIESAGITPRKSGDLYKSGDVVTFIDDSVSEFDVAGKQAIVEYKKTIDGIYEWTATYFNRKTMKIEERPFSEMVSLVDQVFPVRQIQTEVEDRIDTLNEFMAGASAGLRGISKKDFKRDFTLGERFFSEIPTTTILQGSKGFSLAGGFGESKDQQGWAEDIDKYFFKPMTEYRLKTEQLNKLKLEGLEGGKATIGKGFIEEIEYLQTILKNNQIVFQYRAAFVDLTKTMSEGSRVLKENLAIERNRVELQKSTSGYMKGVASGLDNIDLGVRKYEDLSPTQISLRESPVYEKQASRFKEIDITRSALEDQINNASKVLIALKEIRETGKGFGSQLAPEDLSKYVEEVFKTGDTEAAKLTVQTGKVADNTGQTVDRLDQILANMGDRESFDKLVEKAEIYGSTAGGDTKSLKLLSGYRDMASKREDNEGVIRANKAIDYVIKGMADKYGLSKATHKVRFGDAGISQEEFTARAFSSSGLDAKQFSQEFSKFLPEKKWYKPLVYDKKDFADNLKDLRKLQEDNNKQSLFSDKQLIKTQTAVATYSALSGRYSNKMVEKYDDQLSKLDENIAEVKKSGGGPEKIEKLFKERTSVSRARDEEEKSAKLYGTVATMTAMGAGAAELAKIFGLTEGQIKAVGVATMGTYAAFKTASSVIGTEMPESVKKYGQELDKMVKGVAKGEKPSFSTLKDLGKRMKEDYEKVKVSKVDEKLEKEAAGIDYEKIQKDFKEGKYDKEIADNTKKLQEQMLKAGSTDEIQKIIAAYVAMGMAGYVAEKTGEGTRLSTLDSRMKEESKFMSDMINSNKEAADEFYKNLTSRKGGAATTDIEKENIPLVMDAEKEFDKIVNDTQNSVNKLVSAYAKLAEEQSRLADAMYQSQLGSEIKKITANLKASIRDVVSIQSIDIMPTMKQYRDNIESLFGGTHQNAPVSLSVEDMRKASKVGEKLVSGESDKYDLQRSQLKYELAYNAKDEKTRADLRRQLTDIPANKQLELENKERLEQNRLLKEQNVPYESYLKDLSKFKNQPGVSKDLKNEIIEVEETIAKLLEGSTAVVSKEEKINLAAKDAGWKRFIPFSDTRDEYKEAKKRIETAGDLQYRGIQGYDLKDIDSKLKEIYTVLSEKEKEAQIELQSKAVELGIKPMIDQQVITNKLLGDIADKEPEDYVEKKASGGRIFGEGGPREDKVPAYLSPGEFVVRASAAQKIGYDTLSHINKKGDIPKFADGMNDEWTEENYEKKFNEAMEKVKSKDKKGWLDRVKEKFSKGYDKSTKSIPDSGEKISPSNRHKILEEIDDYNVGGIVRFANGGGFFPTIYQKLEDIKSLPARLKEFLEKGSRGVDFEKRYKDVGLPEGKSSQYVQLDKLLKEEEATGFADGGGFFPTIYQKLEDIKSLPVRLKEFLEKRAYGRDFEKEYKGVGLPEGKSSQYVQLDKLLKEEEATGFADGGGNIKIGSGVSEEDKEEILNWLKRDELKKEPFGALIGIPNRFVRSPMDIGITKDLKDKARWFTEGQKPVVDSMVNLAKTESKKRIAGAEIDNQKFKSILNERESKINDYYTRDEFMRNLNAEFFTKNVPDDVKKAHQKAMGFKVEYDERRGMFKDVTTGMGRMADSGPLSYSPINKPTNIGVSRVIDDPRYKESEGYLQNIKERDKLKGLETTALDKSKSLEGFDAGTKALLETVREAKDIKDNRKNIIENLKQTYTDKDQFEKQAKKLFGAEGLKDGFYDYEAAKKVSMNEAKKAMEDKKGSSTYLEKAYRTKLEEKMGIVNLAFEEGKELLSIKEGGRDIVGTSKEDQENVKKFNKLLQTRQQTLKGYQRQSFEDAKSKEFTNAMGIDEDLKNNLDWQTASYINRDRYDELIKLSNEQKDRSLFSKLTFGVFDDKHKRLNELRKYFENEMPLSGKSQIINTSKQGISNSFNDVIRKPDDESAIMEKILSIINSSELKSTTGASGNKGVGVELTEDVKKDLEKFKTFSNGGSLSVMHNGGEITKTGPIFAQKGEVILPRAFADGGIVTDSPASKSLNSMSVSLDISALKGLKLEVEDTKLGVDIPSAGLKVDIPSEGLKIDIPSEGLKIDIPSDGLKVNIPSEGIKVEMPTEMIKVEMPTEMLKVDIPAGGIPVDIPSEGIKVEMPTEGIKVEMPTEMIKVEMPTEMIKVDIPAGGIPINNIDDISTSIANSIRDAVSNINVTVKNETTGGTVGADAIDKLTQTVNSINDKIIVLKGDLEDKIENVKIETFSNNINDLINTKITDITSNINSSINDIKSYVDSQRSNLERTRQEFYYKFDESDKIQREIRTLLNSSLV